MNRDNGMMTSLINASSDGPGQEDTPILMELETCRQNFDPDDDGETQISLASTSETRIEYLSSTGQNIALEQITTRAETPEGTTVESSQPPRRHPKAQPKASKGHAFWDKMRHTKIFQGFWTLEIASIVLSVGCVAAIAAILAVLENKPLSSWKLPWRPNSVVSFLAVVAKAALVFPTAQCISQSKWLYYQQKGHRAIDLQHFEDASRGPLGSFLFMLKFKPRTLVASFACALTVAALAVEIFVQQTIDYRSLAVSIGDASASTRVARRYDTGVGYSGSPNYPSLNAGMQAAIFSGLVGQTIQPPITCPTGNCTWCYGAAFTGRELRINPTEQREVGRHKRSEVTRLLT